MSGGYTPLFASITTGTLYGRWPDIGLWPIVLALADRHGTVDVTPHYLAGVTGLPVEDVIACMKRFCEPDPYSRSKEDGGSRLVLIDDHRDWGWKVVNHGKYREKARKASYDASRTESGADAERKRQERLSRDVPTHPAMTRDDPLSYSDSYTNTDLNPKNSTARKLAQTTGEPEGFAEFRQIFPPRAGSQPWRRAEGCWNARIADGATPAELIAGAKRYRAYIEATGRLRTETVQQAATFLGPENHYRNAFALPAQKETAMEEIQRLNGGTRNESSGRVFDADARPAGLVPLLGAVRR